MFCFVLLCCILVLSCFLFLFCFCKCKALFRFHVVFMLQCCIMISDHSCSSSSLFLLRLHRLVQWMMGRAVLFQIHCTSSMPSAGRPLPPLYRACQTPPQWCEPDPCSDLMTFHLSFHLYYTSPRRHEDVSV